jgi:subtilisin family serine protease
MSSKLGAAALAAGIIALLALPVRAEEQTIGPLDPGAGQVTTSLFPEPLACGGTHDVTVWFVPFTLRPQFTPAQWLVVPPTATLAPDAAFIDVTIPLDKMAPATYTGAVFYRCDKCSAGACANQVRSDIVRVEVAAPATFGASAADENFGGLVDGKPVSIHDLTVNVIGEIKRSSFMQLTGAAAVVTELEDHYVDRALTSNDLSDVTFVKSTSTTDKSGRMGAKVQPVDEEDVPSGNARYVRIPGNVVDDEEIYVGVDMSLKGITEARKNPGQYYVFTLDGQMGVINKADFVHNLAHEGFHASLSGKYNTATKDGKSRSACLEEEQEGFRVGNAAARALGLPEDTTTPGASYGGCSNPGYPTQFPQLVPGQEATDPTRAPPKKTSALPVRKTDEELGYCLMDGSVWRCQGVPEYALACDASQLGGRECSPQGTGLRSPCSFGKGGWTCATMPPAVATCAGGACTVQAVGSSCEKDGKSVRCTSMPSYALSCDASGACGLSDPLADRDLGALAHAASLLYAATQSADCSRAGPGEFRILRPLSGSYGVPAASSRSGGNDLAADIAAALARDVAGTPALPKQPFLFLFGSAGPDAPSNAWPGAGGRFVDVGADVLPQRGVVDVTPGSTGLFGRNGHTYQLQGGYFGSVNVPGWLEDPTPVFRSSAITSRVRIGSSPYTTLLYDDSAHVRVLEALRDAGYGSPERNPCRTVLLPTDPSYRRTGRNGGNSWGEKRDDQWAIKRVGYTDDVTSAWQLVPDTAAPVVVAVIDTGLDWHHADLDPASIWRNDDEIADNGIDDDRNGYVDDLIGWNFVAKTNRPWDYDGHGTLVTGIIAARHNDVGIAGVSPNARIMVLKGINDFGTTRASWLAEAIVYAVDNGARIVNLSVGGPHESKMEQAALDYARRKGVLVVAAAGNSGVELKDFGPGGHDSVLTVGATHVDDRAAAFSNFGDKVDLVAPGVEVLSLRARGTDANYRPWQDDSYKLGAYVVGEDKRYLHASGTSFSTPIVTATAALALGRNPQLTGSELAGILTQTATDIEAPGRDPNTGHGMVNPRAALAAAPGFRMIAEITKVELLPAEAPTHAHVWGTIDATQFKRAWLQIGPGENPGAWRFVGQKRKQPIRDALLATIPLKDFAPAGRWLVVVNVEDKSGVVKRAAFPVRIP